VLGCLPRLKDQSRPEHSHVTSVKHGGCFGPSRGMTQPPQVAARAKPKPPSTPSNPDKQKAAPGRQAAQPQQNANVKLKVVVRGLPPNLPEHKFNEVTAQWINQTTVDWYYYVGGKLHDRYTICCFKDLTLVGINPVFGLERMQSSNLWMRSSLSIKLSTDISSQTLKVLYPPTSSSNFQAARPVQ